MVETHRVKEQQRSFDGKGKRSLQKKHSSMAGKVHDGKTGCIYVSHKKESCYKLVSNDDKLLLKDRVPASKVFSFSCLVEECSRDSKLESIDDDDRL